LKYLGCSPRATLRLFTRRLERGIAGLYLFSGADWTRDSQNHRVDAGKQRGAGKSAKTQVYLYQPSYSTKKTIAEQQQLLTKQTLYALEQSVSVARH